MNDEKEPNKTEPKEAEENQYAYWDGEKVEIPMLGLEEVSEQMLKNKRYLTIICSIGIFLAITDIEVEKLNNFGIIFSDTSKLAINKSSVLAILIIIIIHQFVNYWFEFQLFGKNHLFKWTNKILRGEDIRCNKNGILSSNNLDDTELLEVQKNHMKKLSSLESNWLLNENNSLDLLMPFMLAVISLICIARFFYH